LTLLLVVYVLRGLGVGFFLFCLDSLLTRRFPCCFGLRLSRWSCTDFASSFYPTRS
jgi:hypothetical protein